MKSLDYSSDLFRIVRMKRAQYHYILKDLTKKIALVVGPRQVGKTYLAKQIAKAFVHPLYLNYDNFDDRSIMMNMSWLPKTDLLILDELHKMPDWKNYLKGLYDTKPSTLSLLVTGSARLDVFDKIGDSLAGRYFLHRLLPLSPSELRQIEMPIDLESLLTGGGFPEPYLADEVLDANRWRLQYSHSMLSTDVFDFDMIQNIRALRMVFELLRSKVGSPISYQSIAEDVAVSPTTVKRYIEILETLFLIFRVTPFSKNIARSLLKEPKIYFFDNGLVLGDEGAKLENLVAVCLLKHVYAKIDYHAKPYALHYLRTKDGLEVDFALVNAGEIEQIIEVKNASKAVSPALYSFNKKYGFPAIQLVHYLNHERIVGDVEILSVEHYLSSLLL